MKTVHPHRTARHYNGQSLAALAVLTLCILPLPAARAQTAAVTLSGGIVETAADNGNTSYVLGYTFTVSAPVSVSALGFYDDNNTAAAGTALSQSHRVGIFSDATGTLLVQSTVTPTDPARAAFSGLTATAAQTATDGTGVQLFRYDSALKDGATSLVSVPTFLLTPGTTYTLAAVTGADEYDYLAGSDFAGGTFGTGSSIVYGQDRYVSGNATALSDPKGTTGNMPGGFAGNGYFGPNFLFSPAAAPEPSPFAAFAIGLLGLGALTLRAKRKRPV